MSSNRGFLVLFVGAAAVLTVGFWLGSGRTPPAPDAGPPPYVLPVTLAEVRRGDVHPSVTLTGTFRAARRASLAFDTSGLVVEISARDGDTLSAGQVVARLDARDQEVRVAEARAALAVVQRQLELLLAGERTEVVLRLAAEVEAARAEEELTTIEVQRALNLVGEDLVTQAEADRASAAQRAARARRAAVQARLEEAEAGPRPEDVAVGRARVAAAEEAMARARRDLDKIVLLAPWDGEVLFRAVSPGDHVSAGEPIVEVADVANLELYVEVPARYALHLGEHPPVVVRVDERPDWELKTLLDARIEVADPASRNVRAVARLQGTTGLLPGMFARVELLLDPLTDALIVPADAVRTVPEGTIVVKASPADDGGGGSVSRLVAKWVPVRLLGADDSGVAVEPLAEGLAAGERVVLLGVDLAYPGVALALRPDATRGPDAEATP